MWTTENRARYDRSGLRYPSDLTDQEWALIAPLIPPAKRGGNKRTVDVRAVVNGVMYLLSTGCQWAALPKDLPPRSTVNDYFRRWDEDGTLARIHHALYVQCRELAGRDASLTAAIIDSQSVKSAEKGQQRQAFGRSRVGFSTKIHLKTDLDGNRLDLHLTGDQASDSTQFETSLDIGPDIGPRIAVTDKGYDSDANRAAARARGITP